MKAVLLDVKQVQSPDGELPADVTVKVIKLREYDRPDGSGQLDELQAAVGGWIEAVDLGVNPKMGRAETAYINEEGKLIGLPVNPVATMIAHRARAIAADDVICGPMVLCGFDPDTGENLEASDWMLALASPEAAVAYLALASAYMEVDL